MPVTFQGEVVEDVVAPRNAVVSFNGGYVLTASTRAYAEVGASGLCQSSVVSIVDKAAGPIAKPADMQAPFTLELR